MTVGRVVVVVAVELGALGAAGLLEFDAVAAALFDVCGFLSEQPTVTVRAIMQAMDTSDS